MKSQYTVSSDVWSFGVVLFEISKSIIELQTSQLINESMVQSHTIFTWAFSESNIVRLKKEKDDLNGDYKAEQLFAFGHDDACYQKHFVVSYYLSSNVYSGAFGKEFVFEYCHIFSFFRTLNFKKFLLLFVFFLMLFVYLIKNLNKLFDKFRIYFLNWLL